MSQQKVVVSKDGVGKPEKKANEMTPGYESTDLEQSDK